MKKTRQRLIYLYESTLFTRHMLRKLLQIDRTLEKTFHITPSELSEHLAISSKKATQIYAYLHRKAYSHFKKNDDSDVKVVTILDTNYPSQLKHIYDPPLVLYMAGNIELLHRFPLISVIGTRNPSKEALLKVRHIVSPLIEHRWTIVSGLAYGIDSMAHQLTLDLKGNTIAVLGSGFTYVYPKQNRVLLEKIKQTGLALSEYPPFTRPQKYHFPERNRIISGLSRAVVVIEAKKRSGTLITVDQALEQGKDVYAVPGSIFTEQTSGCHHLIQDGARLITNGIEILEEWQ